MYQNGKGVPQSDTEAVKWFRRAAEQNNADAAANLGWMYQQGEGVLQDDAEAVKWFRLSAEQNNFRAQNNLGTMYAEGKGVPQDDVLAYMWFNLAAASGGDDAARNRDKVAANLTPEQRADAQRMSRECTERNYKDCGR
jgi:TPR repeat protein